GVIVTLDKQHLFQNIRCDTVRSPDVVCEQPGCAPGRTAADGRNSAVVDQAGPAVGRRRLAGELRRHRIHAGLTMRQVATHLDCSAGKISRLEAGLIAPNISDVRIMLALYGVEDQERDTLIEVARKARERAWWHAYTDVVPPESATFFGLEDGAAAISEYSVQVIPGLLQTADYARVLMESAVVTPPEIIARRLELRLRRQQL